MIYTMSGRMIEGLSIVENECSRKDFDHISKLTLGALERRNFISCDRDGWFHITNLGLAVLKNLVYRK